MLLRTGSLNPSLLPVSLLCTVGIFQDPLVLSSSYKPFSLTALSWPPSCGFSSSLLVQEITGLPVRAGVLMLWAPSCPPSLKHSRPRPESQLCSSQYLGLSFLLDTNSSYNFCLAAGKKKKTQILIWLKKKCGWFLLRILNCLGKTKEIVSDNKGNKILGNFTVSPPKLKKEKHDYFHLRKLYCVRQWEAGLFLWSIKLRAAAQTSHHFPSIAQNVVRGYSVVVFDKLNPKEVNLLLFKSSTVVGKGQCLQILGSFHMIFQVRQSWHHRTNNDSRLGMII